MLDCLTGRVNVRQKTVARPCYGSYQPPTVLGPNDELGWHEIRGYLGRLAFGNFGRLQL